MTRSEQEPPHYPGEQPPMPRDPGPWPHQEPGPGQPGPDDPTAPQPDPGTGDPEPGDPSGPHTPGELHGGRPQSLPGHRSRADGSVLPARHTF